jgi:hypothetical protein
MLCGMGVGQEEISKRHVLTEEEFDDIGTL